MKRNRLAIGGRVLLLALGAAGPASLCAEAFPARANLERGRQAYAQGRYEECVQLLMPVLTRNPGQPVAQRYIRLSAQKIREFNEREAERRRRELLGRMQEALEEERLKAEQWKAWYAEARGAARAGRYVLACDRYHRILEENPKYAPAAKGLPAAHKQIVRRMARKLFTDRKEELLHRAFYYYNRKEGPVALEAFEEALDLAETPAELLNEEIERYAERLRESFPGAPRVRPIVKREPRRPKAPAASSKPKPRLEAAPPQPSPPTLQAELELLELKNKAQQHYAQGLVFYGDDKREEAVREWRKALALNPGHEMTRKALEHVLLELKERGK